MVNRAKLYQLIICILLALLLLSGCVRSQPTTSTPTQNPETPATSTTQVKIIIVTSLADSGLSTLREALLSAQGGDTITFDPVVFPPKAPVTIALISSLPTIVQGNLTIDASNAGVILDGSNILEKTANGLTITSVGNTIRGLQIIHFPSAGIALYDNAQNNTIVNNYVGTDAKGITAWGNICGISLNNASYNQITGNLVSGNDPGYGIELFGSSTHDNTISGNRIGTDSSGEKALGNKSAGIAIHDGANHNTIGPDNVIAFNESEIFVDYLNSLENAIIGDVVVIQEGNGNPIAGIYPKNSKQLEDNRFGSIASDILYLENASQIIIEGCVPSGIKRFKWTANEGEARTISGINWSKSEFDIPLSVDEFANNLVKNGIVSTYMLTFWDKANHPQGWQPSSSRFKTEEEIQRYLDYVRFIVHHFKGRINYYELWNEPDMQPNFLHHIDVEDYINLVKRTVPVIRQEDPEAKIVVGGIVLQFSASRDYLFSILRSDIMPLVDVVSWHPMFGVSPEYESEYYYGYPSLVQEIKEVASAHGFQGEYRGEELTWRSPDCPMCDPGDYLYGNTVAAKYYARGIIMHLGMDLTTGVSRLGGGMEMFTVVRNLSTIMEGAKPINISIEVQSTATNIRNYSFTLPDGSQLVALWTDRVAIDDDPGIKTTVTIYNVSAHEVMGIDVLNGFEQPLNVDINGINLVIRDLLIKDYPIFLRLVP